MTHLTRDTRFSYACRACKRCCHMYEVRATPYDLLVLARHLGITTTEVLRRYIAPEGSSLARRQTDGACIFLGRLGCAVHPARPLACRLYPLGREMDSNGAERFFQLEPHPLTEGIYGDASTVGGFLSDQDTREHLDAADRYLQLFCRALAALGTVPGADQADGNTRSDLLDADALIARHRPDVDPSTLDAAASMSLHLEAIETLLLASATHQTGDPS